MEISKLFTEHPTSVRKTYTQHFGHAIGFGTRLVVAGIACILHGFMPFIFFRTGSRTVAKLNERMTINCRAALSPSQTRVSGSPAVF
jgi:hypothetical protein